VARVRPDAPYREDDRAATKSTRLALGTQKTVAEVDGEVVSLIRAERRQHSVAAPDERGQNDRLRPLSNVDRMSAQRPRRIR
jgi:hypothetical protein